MNKLAKFEITDDWILSNRGKKNLVDPYRPYHLLVEEERSANGTTESVATIFLTNRACPFRCLMCDLWKNTTDKTVPVGAIPQQIEWALSQLPPANHLKLYNSGNFFDVKAIPEADYEPIAKLVSGFKSVTVESHPKLLGNRVLKFQKLLKPKLEVALGLETVHPDVLIKLNKRMNLDEFTSAITFLSDHNISSRAFILLKPPFLNETEGVEWAKKSIDFAFATGVECVVVIPTRAGNGALDLLAKEGLYSSPTIYSLEEVLDYGVEMGKGRVFADLWDIQKFSTCSHCLESRINRIHQINLTQISSDPVRCNWC